VRGTGVAADNRIELRIGINLGDVIVEGDDLYGDGVNIAARIEALAEAGRVFVSNTVHDHVRDRLPFVFEDLGEQQVKNIARPVRVYRVRDTAAKAPVPPVLPLPDKPSIAVLPFANMSGVRACPLRPPISREYPATSAARIAARRRVWLMSPRRTPGAGPTGTARGARKSRMGFRWR
jgi:hypothetical protein